MEMSRYDGQGGQVLESNQYKLPQSDPQSYTSVHSTPRSKTPTYELQDMNKAHVTESDSKQSVPFHQLDQVRDLATTETPGIKKKKKKGANPEFTASIDDFLEKSRQQREQQATYGNNDYQEHILNTNFDHEAVQRRETRISNHNHLHGYYQYGSQRNGTGTREASCNGDLEDLGPLGIQNKCSNQSQGANGDLPVSTKDSVFKNKDRKGPKDKQQMVLPSVFSERRYTRKDVTKQSVRSKNQTVSGQVQHATRLSSQQHILKSKQISGSSQTLKSKPLKKFSQVQGKSNQNSNSKTKGKAYRNLEVSDERILQKINITEPNSIEYANEKNSSSIKKEATPKLGLTQDLDEEETTPLNLSYNQIQKSAKSLRDQIMSNGLVNETSTPVTQSLKLSRSIDPGLTLFFPGLFNTDKPATQIKRHKSKPNGELQKIGETKEDFMVRESTVLKHKDEWSQNKQRVQKDYNIDRTLTSKANGKVITQVALNSAKLNRKDNPNFLRSEKRGEKADVKRSLSRANHTNHRVQNGGDFNLTIEKQNAPVASTVVADSTIAMAATKQNQYPTIASALLSQIVVNQEEKNKIESQANFLARKQKALKQVAEYKEKKAAEKERGNPIVCHCVSVEPYIRRAINAIGWRENKQTGSTSFHIKFDVSDIDVKVKPNQFYNHFPDNRHLTTKVGLCKNLCYQTPYENLLQIQSFFPRCYDLSDQVQADLFKEDFYKTAIFSIIKVLAGEILNLKNQITRFVELYAKRKEYENPHVYLKWFERECYKHDESKGGMHYNELVQVIKNAFSYCQQHIDRLQDQFDFKLFGAPISQSLTVGINGSSNIKFSADKLDTMLQLHEQIVGGVDSGDQSFAGYLVQFLSTNFQVKILELHNQLQSCCNQYAQIDGHKNIWVVKASYNARGVGIYCANKLNDIYQEGKKSQSKVVQKYIERPFLVHQRKFDVRQWVLVTSWDPLDAFVFESAYLKICSSEFSMDQEDLTDVYRHLANYTIQRKNAQIGEGLEWQNELIMSSAEFESYNQQEAGLDFQWNRDLLPKIQDVIFRTLKAVQETQLSSLSETKANCFEIYGFDLVLDQELNPWVIEINLSPACKERTPWLTKMLDDSALDLLLWIERRILFNSQIERENFTKSLREKKNKYAKNKQNNYYNKIITLNDEETQKEHNIQSKWVRIPACLDELDQFDLDQQVQQTGLQSSFKQYNASSHFRKESIVTDKLQIQAQQNLEIQATKADLKYEKKIQTAFKKVQSTHFIQRVWRGHKARLLATHLRRTNASIIIQKYARRRAAIKLRKLLKLHKCSNMLQNQLRRILAKRRTEELQRMRIQKAKDTVALMLQSQYRRWKAKRQVHELRLNTRATTLQKFMKGLLEHRKARKTLYERVMIRRIQLYYKRRYRGFEKSASKVQCVLKGYKEYKKWQRLKVVALSAVKINKMVEARWRQMALDKFRQNKNIIKIQCRIRIFLARKRLDNLRTLREQSKLKDICQRYKQLLLKQHIIQAKVLLNDKVSSVQRVMKTFLALKKLRTARQTFQSLETSSELIQKYLKGYYSLKQTRLLIAKRNTSACKIQSLFKMYITRKGYLAILEEIDQLHQQQEDLYAGEKISRGESIEAEDGEIEETGSPDRCIKSHAYGGLKQSQSQAKMLNHDDGSKSTLQETGQKCSQRLYQNKQRKKSEKHASHRSNFKDEAGYTKIKMGDRGLKSSERTKRQSSRTRKKSKQVESATMTKQEKTVRALEDQFYGRSKEIDAQVLKSLKKLDAIKQSSRKNNGLESGHKATKLLVQPGIYGGLEPPKKKDKRYHHNAAPKTGNEGGRGSSSLSFAENLKNLLATQSMHNNQAIERHLSRPPQPAKPHDVPNSQPTQLFLRHYRPSGPLQASDFMEDFKLSQENFRKSQEQARKLKTVSQNQKNSHVEPNTVAASVISWGKNGDKAHNENQKQKYQHTETQGALNSDDLVIGDESFHELQKLQQMQSSYGNGILMIDQNYQQISIENPRDQPSSVKRQSDLPEIHSSMGKAILQSSSMYQPEKKNYRTGDLETRARSREPHNSLPDQDIHSTNVKQAILSNMTQRKQVSKFLKQKVHIPAQKTIGGIAYDHSTKPPPSGQPRQYNNQSQQKLKSSTIGKMMSQQTSSENHNCYTPQILQASKKQSAEMQKSGATDMFMPALDPSLTIGKQTSQNQICDTMSIASSQAQSKCLKISNSIGELPSLGKLPQSNSTTKGIKVQRGNVDEMTKGFPSFARNGQQ